uniref:Peroxiredoxin-5 n=1 Tax=Timema poppense TaxID=170557 RepID=A0A7R9DDV1_TIMPO|nr:unnamed protein product [Timema poppensis]
MICSQAGDRVPSVDLYEDNPTNKVNVADLFKGKKGILFAVPGAFTPGCSKKQRQLLDIFADHLITVVVHGRLLQGLWFTLSLVMTQHRQTHSLAVELSLPTLFCDLRSVSIDTPNSPFDSGPITSSLCSRDTPNSPFDSLVLSQVVRDTPNSPFDSVRDTPNCPFDSLVLSQVVRDTPNCPFDSLVLSLVSVFQTHLPGYVTKAEELKGKGIQEIVCVSVNDPFVMSAWGKEHGANGKVRMLADPSAAFAKALDLQVDLPPLGGVRSKRYSMVVEDCVIKTLNVEPDGTGLSCSLADKIPV